MIDMEAFGLPMAPLGNRIAARWFPIQIQEFPMADAETPAPDENFDEQIETNQALEQGLGIGARELASIHESGAAGTLEQGGDGVEGPDEDALIGGAGRAERKS